MTYNSIEEHAATRQQEWLAKHGQHEWEKHDLQQETLERLADAWNYITELEKRGWHMLSPKMYLRQVWEIIHYDYTHSSS